jgi:ATP-dependent helicase HrpA
MADSPLSPSPRRGPDRRLRAIESRRVAAEAIVREGRLRYPDSLPITARHDELLAAIRTHQVVVVAGETGSGKSTQLPKLCIEGGRGVEGLIGHTQPRRVAARTIAERVAEELGSDLGTDVGYTVRFTDQVSERTLVRVMTDGILLAEIQRDRMLRRYDTIIIDEAHERSLNIDFLLGYLRQLLPRRPDLKVVITSATIDTARFAAHFSSSDTTVPVIEVTGRTFPVEVRYRPFGEAPDDDRDQVQAISDAIEELEREGPGDVLVFVSGEREIRDTADALQRRIADGAAGRRGGGSATTEVLPLYARLSSAEQHRIFERRSGQAGRRVVLSTNVAETSLTVPGVRYVVDAGNARISRYSRRLKVQRLPIESISQASANQRSGRCGRVAAGVAIRLYSDEDFAARPEFTEPEILRTNLASAILQMTAIGLGDVAAFPFVEPPDAASIRDGYLLLEELGAIGAEPTEGTRPLTETGRRLARLPLDPRLGRMVLEAARLDCVRDVMIIASALSIQDPRERPQDRREVADALHKRFDVAGSDLLSIVALWDHLREQQRALSSNQFRKLCRAEYLNYLRVREWHDLFSQLRRVAGELKISVGTTSAHPEHVHRAVLSGLLSHIGLRQRETRSYRGARNASFTIAPGSVLTKKPPQWVVAAELVETNQLWARRVATIQPQWAEQAGEHIVKRSYGDPVWSSSRGAAITTETVTLYGLPIVTGRTVLFDRVDPDEARAMFIRHALVEGDWQTHHAFVEHNRDFVETVREIEARVRRLDLLDDDTLEAFYDKRVGHQVVSSRHFDQWWKRTRGSQPDLLDLTEDALDLGDVHLADFPDTWAQGSVNLPLTYRFDPGGPLDGVSVHIPLDALNQIDDDGFDWQIPGHRLEVVRELVRTLPKNLRRDLAPLAETTQAVADRLGTPSGLLVDRLALVLCDVSGLVIAPEAFDSTRLSPDLRVHFVVADDTGKVHDAGTDLYAIKARLERANRAAVAAASPLVQRRGITTWDLGTLAPVVEARREGYMVRGYPALLDDGERVSLRILTDPEMQARVMRGGVRRLLLRTAAPTRKAIERGVAQQARLALATSPFSFASLVDDCIAAAVDAVMARAGGLPWDEAAFGALQDRVRAKAAPVATAAVTIAVDIAAAASRVHLLLDRLTADAFARSTTDAREHLDRLVRPGFVLAVGVGRLRDVLRYVRGIEYRLERVATDLARDERRQAEVRPLERRYRALVDAAGPGSNDPDLVELGWRFEELRMSVFAQPLGVQGTISATRLARDLADLGA